MVYNLVKNSVFTSTADGNKILTQNELSILKDGDTTVSGISLLSSDVLHLEVDLSYRTLIEYVKVYLNSPTASGTVINNINFYAKNSVSDNYTVFDKYIGTDCYYSTLSGIASPRYIKVVIDSVDSTLYELVVYSNGYEVAFGETGSLDNITIEEAMIGYEGTVVPVKVYNNGDNFATAYVVVDYNDDQTHRCVKISDSVDGPWLGYEDGFLSHTNMSTDEWPWSFGNFVNNTEVNLDKLTLVNSSLLTGTYVSPIYEVDDKYKSSYLYMHITSTSGTGVDYSGTGDNTIRIRSSDVCPEINKVAYWPVDDDVSMFSLSDGSRDDSFYSLGNTAYYPVSAVVDNLTGYIYISTWYDAYTDSFRYYVLDSDSNVIRGISSIRAMKLDRGFEIDAYGGFWGLDSNYYVIHLNSNWSETFYSTGLNAFGIAGSYNSSHVWYTSMTDNHLYYIDAYGNELLDIALGEPRGVCRTSDGCWVHEKEGNEFRRYDTSGNLLKKINMPYDNIDRLYTDLNDGVWYTVNSDTIYHIDSEGVEICSSIFQHVGDVTGLPDGAVVGSNTYDWLKYVDNTGNVVYTFNTPGSTQVAQKAGVLYIDYSGYRNLKSFTRIPRVGDPVWEDTNSSDYVDWVEVPADGYYLPKNRYFQVEVTLRTDNTDVAPFLGAIGLMPVIKVPDIPSKGYKTIYIKSSIPKDITEGDYSSNLRVWWGKE